MEVAGTLAAEAGAAAEAGGVAALGLDGWGLVFQIINFIVLLLLLRRFAYRPLLKILETRRRTVEESLAAAAEIERQREALVREQRAVMAQSRREAEALVARSQAEARAVVEQARAAGEAAAAALRREAEAKIAREVASARRELRRETLRLVAAATERVVQAKIDAESDARLIESAVASARRALKQAA